MDEDAFHYGYRVQEIPWVSFEEVGVAVININALKELELDMQAVGIDHMFRFTYEKSSEEIKEKALAKIKVLQAKVEERKIRVKKTRDEYKVTDEVMSNILMQMRQASNNERASYTVSNTSRPSSGGGTISEEIVVPAGVINNILTEQDYIKSETDQVDKLNLVYRNLKDLKGEDGNPRGHKLNEQELIYLGF